MVEPPGQHGLVERLATIERRISETQRAIPARPGMFGGQWWMPSDAQVMNIAAGATVTTTAINTPLETPQGCSYVGGVFTADKAGWWLLNLSVQFVGDGGRHWVWFGPANGSIPRYGGEQVAADYHTVCVPLRFSAGGQARTLVSPVNGTGLYPAQGGNRFHAVWLGS